MDDKLSREISELGAKAGGLTAEAAGWTGLQPGTAVAIANVDAHVAVPASTVVEPGRMVIIMGTSNCHMVLGTEEHIVPGMCGYVEDGIIPGFFGYEAGQSCVGDHFAWFTENCVPAAYEREAQARGISIHQLLEEKAGQLKPGESGLLALDWWNGNRSVLVDVDLTGLLIGATLLTKPEEIYRALIEATAYGTRIIIETFQANGVPIHQIVATGGLPDRNKLLMQIYADVTGRPIVVAGTHQGGGLGSAMHGAVAAGSAAGGYDTIVEAAQHMASLRDEAYTPNPDAKAVYDQLFAEYVTLHDYFGRGANDVMKRLKILKAQSARLGSYPMNTSRPRHRGPESPGARPLPDADQFHAGVCRPSARRHGNDRRKTLNLSHAGHNPHGGGNTYELERVLGEDLLQTSVGWANSYYQAGDTYVDEWGITWTSHPYETPFGTGHYTEMTRHPLADARALDNYRPPDPHRPELYEDAARLLADYGAEYWIVGVTVCTIFETAWALRGYEQMLTDFVTDPGLAEQILEIPYNYHLAAAERLTADGRGHDLAGGRCGDADGDADVAQGLAQILQTQDGEFHRQAERDQPAPQGRVPLRRRHPADHPRPDRVRPGRAQPDPAGLHGPGRAQAALR